MFEICGLYFFCNLPLITACTAAKMKLSLCLTHHIWGIGKILGGFWYGNLEEIDHLEDLDVDGRILWWILNRLGGVDWFAVV